jgi:hypothetical protein
VEQATFKARAADNGGRGRRPGAIARLYGRRCMLGISQAGAMPAV